MPEITKPTLVLGSNAESSPVCWVCFSTRRNVDGGDAVPHLRELELQGAQGGKLETQKNGIEPSKSVGLLLSPLKPLRKKAPKTQSKKDAHTGRGFQLKTWTSVWKICVRQMLGGYASLKIIASWLLVFISGVCLLAACSRKSRRQKLKSH